VIIKPTGNKLLLKKIEEEFSPGGLVMPRGMLQSNATVAKVLETGRGYKNDDESWAACLIKKGQKVIFNADAGLKVPREVTKTTELILIREDQIFGIIENEPAGENKRKPSKPESSE